MQTEGDQQASDVMVRPEPSAAAHPKRRRCSHLRGVLALAWWQNDPLRRIVVTALNMVTLAGLLLIACAAAREVVDATKWPTIVKVTAGGRSGGRSVITTAEGSNVGGWWAPATATTEVTVCVKPRRAGDRLVADALYGCVGRTIRASTGPTTAPLREGQARFMYRCDAIPPWGVDVIALTLTDEHGRPYHYSALTLFLSADGARVR